MTTKMGVLGKAINVIRMFVDTDHSEWGVRELAKEVDLPVATLHRILTQLQEEDIIKFNENSSKYSIGMELIRLSAKVSNNIDIKKITRPLLESLVMKYKETACLVLYSREKRKIIWVDKVNGDSPLQYIITLGEYQPVPYGSSGKSILAFLEDQEIVEICKSENFSPEKIEDLMIELNEIRKSKVSVTTSERLIGSKGVASPIFNSANQVIGSIVISAPIERMDILNLEDLKKDVVLVASEISNVLGAK